MKSNTKIYVSRDEVVQLIEQYLTESPDKQKHLIAAIERLMPADEAAKEDLVSRKRVLAWLLKSNHNLSDYKEAEKAEEELMALPSAVPEKKPDRFTLTGIYREHRTVRR